MKEVKNYIKKYYGSSGQYLRNHADFFSATDINSDLNFLTKALKLQKTDRILDIACGQGRHTNALARKGYSVDGVDFSGALLDMAQIESASMKRKPGYFLGNVENFKLPNKYSKAYWFFSDLASIDLPKAVESIGQNIKSGGMILIDTDNIFRILAYISKNPASDFDFDAGRLELIDKKNNLRIKYPVLPLWNQWLCSAGFAIKDVWGDYKFSKYSIKSPRLIILAKKSLR